MGPVPFNACPMSRQRGTAALEFALISVVFFTLLFGIIEVGRVMYVWNTVQEVTRRAAREAVVWNPTAGTLLLRRQATFHGWEVGDDGVRLPAAPEISSAEVHITYLDANRAEVSASAPLDPLENLSACGDISRVNECIRYVRAEVCVLSGEQGSLQCGAIQYQPMIGFLLGMGGIDFRVSIPASPVVMPAESLGLTVSG